MRTTLGSSGSRASTSRSSWATLRTRGTGLRQRRQRHPGLPRPGPGVRDTYAARSTATNKNSLYDSYIRAIKWATLRIRDRGVIGYVTNGGWLDSNTADGLRLTLAEEFSDIYVFNLRGNQRTKGEQSRQEGGKVFGTGSRATVAITLLVKDPAHTGPAQVHYTDIGDYLTREQKLAKISAAGRVTGLEPVTHLMQNSHGDWLNQRRADFTIFVPIVSSATEDGLFERLGPGVQSNRDPWVYNASGATITNEMAKAVEAYAKSTVECRVMDVSRIKWSSSLEGRFQRGEALELVTRDPVLAIYRPFERQFRYPDWRWIHRPGVGPWTFPAPRIPNLAIAVTGIASHDPFSLLLVDHEPNQLVLDTTQYLLGGATRR